MSHIKPHPPTQCARRHGLCSEALPYHELSALVRLQVFRVSGNRKTNVCLYINLLQHLFVTSPPPNDMPWYSNIQVFTELCGLKTTSVYGISLVFLIGQLTPT